MLNMYSHTWIYSCLLIVFGRITAMHVLAPTNSTDTGVENANPENHDNVYVVVLKKTEDNSSSVPERIPRDIIRQTFSMKGYTAIEIQANNTAVLDDINSMEEVELVEADVPVTMAACRGQDTGDELWGLTRISSVNRTSYTDNWYTFDSEYNGRGVNIYVLDSGVKVDHEDFEGRARWGYTVNALKHEGDSDLEGHGTQVAGVAAGKKYGVAKDASIIAVKVLDRKGAGFASYILEGLQWVYNDTVRKRSGYRAVVNLSLGSPKISAVMEAAVKSLVDSGFPIIVAAGNYEVDACLQSPGRLDEVITVSATDERDRLSTYTNFGPCVDLSAPGNNIRSAHITSTSSYKRSTGTSMAAPFVAGAIAQMISQHGYNPSPYELADWVIGNSSKSLIDFSTHLGGVNVSRTPNRLLHSSCKDNPVLYQEGLSTGALVAIIVSSAVVGVLLIGVIIILSIRKCGIWKAKLQVTPNDPVVSEKKQENQAVWSTRTDKS